MLKISLTTPLEDKFNNKPAKVSACFNNDDNGASEKDDNIFDAYASFLEGVSTPLEGCYNSVNFVDDSSTDSNSTDTFEEESDSLHSSEFNRSFAQNLRTNSERRDITPKCYMK